MFYKFKAVAGVLGAVALIASSAATAAVIDCDEKQASANAYAQAHDCKATSDNPGSPTAEAAFVNSQFQGEGDAFFFVDKTGPADSNTLAGFELTAKAASPDDPFTFLYTLIVPDAWKGVVVDWVLGVKQGNSLFAYLFKGVTLGIEGGFNSFKIKCDKDDNCEIGEDNTYSHSSGFIRGTPNDVPEPAMLGLFGVGLLGMGFAARRRRSS